MNPCFLGIIGFRFALIAAVAAITWLATTSAPAVVEIPVWDKAQHALAFMVLAFLIDYARPTLEGTFSRANKVKWGLLIAYGVGLELLQWQLGDRVPEAYDVIADVAGIGVYCTVRPILGAIGPLAALNRFGSETTL